MKPGLLPCVFILLSLFLYGNTFAQDQPGSIRGSVYDKDFNAPLTNVLVVIAETGQKVTSTEQGNFVFPAVLPGRYTLVFSKEGYIRQVKADVSVSAGSLTDVDAYLPGEFTELDEFVVQDIQIGGAETVLLKLRFESAALMDSISSDLMNRAGASDAAAALKLVSGASVQDGKYAVVRGLPDRYVVSLMNNVRLPSADENKRAVQLDQFPSAVIQSVQVSKTFTPDQQGDASGGAVNIVLKGIPDASLFQFKGETGFNSQVRNRDNFLSYPESGMNYWGKNGGGHIQPNNTDWSGPVGVSEGEAPDLRKWSVAAGGKHEFENGLKIGGFASFFYEHDASYYDNGIDDSRWVYAPGQPLTPQFSGASGDEKTSLYNVTQGSETIQWGALGTFGVEIADQALSATYLYTRTAENTATLAEDTRGKAYFFPGYNPNDPNAPGNAAPNTAPYLRLETLEYTERTATTLQFNGRHKISITEPETADGFLAFLSPSFDWTVSKNSAISDQPDKRQFAGLWKGVSASFPEGQWDPYKPAENFNLGNVQRIWKKITEDSDQYAANLKFPFKQWTDTEGYFKFGLFHDRVVRNYSQDTFTNPGETGSHFDGGFDEFWSAAFPSETHLFAESPTDVDYKGHQAITAQYGMLDLPITSFLNVIGGVRFEKTELDTTLFPEAAGDNSTFAVWFPPGESALTQLQPGDADVHFTQRDVLPSFGLVLKPVNEITFRASYSETVARQIFKELTPVLQQEYLGAPIFIGNPELKMSKLKNYDLRLDYAPYEGSLVSVSWFKKRIKDPIEYVQRVGSGFTYTTPVNYPTGKLQGYELEVRQNLGRFLDSLDGMSVGANATVLDSQVTLPGDEAGDFSEPGIQAPMNTRDMLNAPEHLYNLYMTYDIAPTKTQAAIFYTVQGDTLVAGAGQTNGHFVPNVYAKQYGTLNVTVAQKLGDYFKLQLQGKNLLNPNIEEVYRSSYIGSDVTKTSYTKGVNYSFILSAEFKF